MFKEETKELKMSNEFRKKIEIICKFACVKYELINGNIISVKNTNLAYVSPPILKVKGNDYLLFEDSNMVFINGYKDAGISAKNDKRPAYQEMMKDMKNAK